MSELIKPLQAYLQHKLPEHLNLSIEDFERIPGGASCETFRFRVNYTEQGVEKNSHWILRRSPDGGLVETERRTEFNAYKAFFDSDVPVPRPVILEEDTSHLGRSFMIVEEIRDCEASLQALMVSPYVEHKHAIGRQKWTILGQIAKADPAIMWSADELAKHDPATSWKTQLAYWEGQILKADPSPNPLILAVLRWMCRNPPPAPERLSIVHGDYRSGNFLYNTQGEVTAILDWEMCHAGDPLEDVAWAMTSVWSAGGQHAPGRLLEKELSLQIWEAASGMKADPVALRWWEIFSCIKGLGVWATAGVEARKPESKDALLLGSAIWATDLHLQELATTFKKIMAEGEL